MANRHHQLPAPPQPIDGSELFWINQYVEVEPGVFRWGPYKLTISELMNHEVDPIFQASPAANVTNTLIGQWSAAYSWGDHAGKYYSRGGSGGTITISDQDPSGGADGDIWFKVD